MTRLDVSAVATRQTGVTTTTVGLVGVSVVGRTRPVAV